MKRYKTEIVAENVILLSSPAGREEHSGGYSAVADSAPQEIEKSHKSRPKPEEDITIEDIPF